MNIVIIIFPNLPTYMDFFFKFSDPRLRKSKDENRKMKEGSLGELLETDRPKRSAKFKGA